MLTIIIQVNAPPWQARGIKEDLAMYVERWGDTRIVSVEEKAAPPMEQMVFTIHSYSGARRIMKVCK